MEIKADLKAALIFAMRDALDEAMKKVSTDVIDAYVSGYLEEADCWLRFEDGEPVILVGLGPGDAICNFTPEMSLDDYASTGGIRSEEQLEDVNQQIDGIRMLIDELMTGMAILVKQADDYHAMTRRGGRLRVVSEEPASAQPPPPPQSEASTPPEQSPAGPRAEDT